MASTKQVVDSFLPRIFGLMMIEIKAVSACMSKLTDPILIPLSSK
jgi:hypothetical protein